MTSVVPLKTRCVVGPTHVKPVETRSNIGVMWKLRCLGKCSSVFSGRGSLMAKVTVMSSSLVPLKGLIHVNYVEAETSSR
ncbi:hypothetical protein TNCV_3758671 [Trichonephila clavipes]|nr:hypothetical protein TNCV_3758671 [Trichonephila clavipes]